MKTANTEQSFRHYYTARYNRQVVVRAGSLMLLEAELKEQGFSHHRVKYYKGHTVQYIL